MPRKSFAETVRSWELMLEQLRPLLADHPEVAPQHAELERLLAEARRQSDRVKELGAERKLAARLCREALKAGLEERGRIAGFLVTHLGTKSEQLLGFGLHPRPRKLRRRTKAERALASLKAASGRR